MALQYSETLPLEFTEQAEQSLFEKTINPLCKKWTSAGENLGMQWGGTISGQVNSKKKWLCLFTDGESSRVRKADAMLPKVKLRGA